MKKCLSMLLVLVMMMALMLPVAAAKSDFVPSAEVKPAPGVVQKPTEDGTPSYGEIVMPDGTVIPVPGTAIIITPLQGADSAEPPSIGDELDKAYEELLDADTLEDLVEDLQEVLDQIIAENDTLGDVDIEDLVISDIFHVYLPDEYTEYLEQGGVLKITFEADADVILALMSSDSKWSALFGNNLVDNGDGTYTLTISKSGVVAFLKNAASVDVDPDAPGVSSPTTGDTTVMYIVMGSVLLLAVAAFAVASKKQRV